MKYSFYFKDEENKKYYPKDLIMPENTWWNTTLKVEAFKFPSLSFIRYFIKKYNDIYPKYELKSTIFNI